MAMKRDDPHAEPGQHRHKRFVMWPSVSGRDKDASDRTEEGRQALVNTESEPKSFFLIIIGVFLSTYK